MILGDLTGKSAFVTGGGQGIGRGIALTLARLGARVVLADIALDRANEVSEEIGKVGRESLVVETDVKEKDQVNAAVVKALEAFGQLDILVNNAGVSALGENAWQDAFAVNVMGVVNCCEAVTPHMRERNYGKIVNIASMSGHAARTTGGAYPVSKAAVLRYTKGLAYELAPSGINVNAICPGAVWTELQQSANQRAREQNPEMAELDPYEFYITRYKQIIPMGRPQSAEDVGKAVAFLASDDASNITGQCLHVDGGAILRD